jgi:hypothetical protein
MGTIGAPSRLVSRARISISSRTVRPARCRQSIFVITSIPLHAQQMQDVEVLLAA